MFTMSDKKRKRGRPRLNQAVSNGSEFKMRNRVSANSRTIKKPKYLQEQEEENNRSRASTPNRSIDNNSNHSRGSFNGSRVKNSRGYNPGVDDKDSEYHYGSDFDLDEDSDAEKVQNPGVESVSFSDGTSEAHESEFDDLNDASEGQADSGSVGSGFVPFWKLGPAGTLGYRAQTPVPVWLQDRDYPNLDLPRSSDDLLIPKPFVLQAVGIYEVLRHFSNLVRLSPFHFEDFCAALLAEEQNLLLAEVHIALTKAIIREEEAQQTHFGLLDQKDSINIALYFVDSLTWAETLRQYLFCDPSFSYILNILNSCNYPSTSLKNRLTVLQFLCDQFLQTSVVREFLLRDGKIRYDDHCRACHKTGDLLCCDSCSAVYHIECASPPLVNAAAEMDDWTCSVCNIHKLEGVTNCLSLMEASGLMGRQDPLGYDRHGRKYWFLVRRIFVESENGEVNYYSTLEQFDLIIALMDGVELEESLYFAFKEFGDDIRRQMEITEKLTDKARGSKIAQITLETEESREKIEELKSITKPKTESEADEKIIDEAKYDVKLKEEDVTNKEAVSKEVKDEVKPEIKSEIKEEDIGCAAPSGTSLGTKSKEVHKKMDESMGESQVKLKELVEVKPVVYEDSEIEAMVKTKLQQLHYSSNGLPYRLGCDNNYRSYVNQFVINSLALNKIQYNEERDKKRHLAHKFGLSNSADFKWSGSIYGTKDTQITTVRHTLLSLEQNISSHFFHSNWHIFRKLWNTTVGSSTTPKQFARAMVWLVAALKPIVFIPLWHEGLGHVRLKRITAIDREERKKQEKREKREADEESKMFPFIKYTKLVKHQLWKVKGEEYRMHGLWGWQWLSAHRTCHHIPMSTVGLRAGPDKVTLAVKGNGDTIKGLPISGDLYKVLLAQNSSLRTSILSPNQLKAQNEDCKEKGENTSNQKEIVVANAGSQQRLQITSVKLEDYFEDGLINVSKALNSCTRFIYSKIGKGSTLDSLLTRRLSLKLQEEREIASRKSAKKVEVVDVPIDVVNDETDSVASDATDDENVEELPDSQRIPILAQGPTGNLLREMRNYKLRYEALDKIDEFLPCYSPLCRTLGRTNCYSPSCMLKEKTKMKLLNCVSNYKIVSSKKAPYDTVGSHSPIRLREDDDEIQSKEKKAESILAGSLEGSQTETISKASSASATSQRDSEERIFSPLCPSGKIYLKKTNFETRKTKKPYSKLPQICNFKIPFKRKRENLSSVDSLQPRYTIFSLPPYEVQVMARKAGCYNPSGFNPNAKSNHFTWVYPSSRPNFKVTWLYKSVTMPNINAVAYQLRILWACLRWDDMHEKGPHDGRKQITTDLEIIQTEILKRKYYGRFLERTEYLRRKVTIPLDVPKTIREFTPSQRSGLRKRKRAQSPVNKQPESIEEWVDEEKLDLWEVRYFGERIEKAAQLSKKALLADKENSAAVIHQSTSPADFKAKIEEQMKIQRATFNQKKILQSGQSPGIIKVAIGSAVNPSTGSQKLIGNTSLIGASNVVSVSSKLPSAVPTRKIVATKGGRIITVQTTSSSTSNNVVNTPQKFTIGKNSTVFPVSNLPKVQVTSQGNKIIKLQNLPQVNQRTILPRAGVGSIMPISTSMIRPVTPVSGQVLSKLTSNAPAVRPTSTGTPIQLIRLPDGQLQVKGLQNGQQLIHKGDGKIHILSTKPTQQVNSTSLATSQVTQPKALTTIKGITPLSSGQVLNINGQKVIIRTGGPNGKQLIGVNANEVAVSPEPKVNTNPAPRTVSSFKNVKAPDGFSIKPLTPHQPVTSLLKEKQLQNLTNQQSSPVASPIKSTTTTTTLTLRVQVRMTEQGPKTIIQGLQPGVGLTKDHIMAIQQQVRTMLAQYNLQVNQLSPLMTLTLHITNKAAQPPSSPQTPINNQGMNKATPTKIDTEETNSSNLLPEKIVVPMRKLASDNAESLSPTSKEEMKAKDSQKPFVVANDYIQQTVKSALTNKVNLAPDVEHKLVQLPKFATEKPKPDVDNDEEEEEELIKGIKRQREKDENDYDVIDAASLKSKSKRAKSEKPKRKDSLLSPTPNAKSQIQEAKKKALKQQKLEALLAKHKDLLKKDVLKKRALLEKELQIQIHKELAVARKRMQLMEKIRPTSTDVTPPTPSPKKKQPEIAPPVSQSTPISNESKLRSHASKKSDSVTATATTHTPVTTAKTLQKTILPQSKNKKSSKSRNKKIVCICRTPFDDTKFYVGCDLCGNWFHGDCVGITESLSRTLSEYVCDDCANAKLNKDLFCFCRQPYDESQFYICCERCEDWYHGKCIGIMQAEADDIDDYICPKCDPNNLWNRPCQKKLTSKEYVELKKVSKNLIQHKNAWPFLEPVDKSEVPDYYKVVKEPMDLKAIDAKVNKQKYENLSKFVADVMLVFDNCRAYNPPNSSFCSCAQALEIYFCQRLKQLKQRLSQKL